MSSKETIGSLLERSARGEELDFNEVQKEIFAAVVAMLYVLQDESVPLDDPRTSEATRNFLVTFMLASPLPHGLGRWPKSDKEKQHELLLKVEANELYKQRRKDYHEVEDAAASWQHVVREMKTRHPKDAALEVKDKEGREREKWEVLRDRWYGR